MDLKKVFKEFHLNGSMCESLNSAFLTLVPEKECL